MQQPAFKIGGGEWVSWMLVVNKLCFEAPLGFIWMPLMQLDVLDVYGCPR